MFTRKPRLQLEKFAINGAKRLLQHNLPTGDICGAANSPGEMPRPMIKKLICTCGLAANQGPTRYERVRNLALILQWYSPSHGSRGSYA